jgi:TraM recognition site of TraD and TraG
MSKKEKSMLWEILEKILKRIFKAVYNLGRRTWRRIWRRFKKRFIKVKDDHLIYGEKQGKEIFDTLTNRNQPTYIKGLTGFGKTALSINLAIQDIEQGLGGIYLDPHGDLDSDKPGGCYQIYTRVRSLDNVVFISANQGDRVTGENPLFLVVRFEEIERVEELIGHLLNTMFDDALSSGHEVVNAAEFIIESTVFFHNAYFDYLLINRNKSAEEAKNIILTHQVTVNDLAHLIDRPLLIDLFIRILGFKPSKFYRPDLVERWLKIKQKGSFEEGFKGVVGRFKKMVSTPESKFFFESSGFNLLKELQKGKFVLCDISKLDSFTVEMISKLILVKVYKLHRKGDLRQITRFYIDEASNIELSNAPEIMSKGRSSGLFLILIFQYFKQFRNPRIMEALLKAAVIKISFRSEEGDGNFPLEKVANLPNRYFNIRKKDDIFEEVKTLDMPPKIRELKLEERGMKKEGLRKRIMAKLTDIYSYFIDV